MWWELPQKHNQSHLCHSLSSCTLVPCCSGYVLQRALTKHRKRTGSRTAPPGTGLRVPLRQKRAEPPPPPPPPRSGETSVAPMGMQAKGRVQRGRHTQSSDACMYMIWYTCVHTHTKHTQSTYFLATLHLKRCSRKDFKRHHFSLICQKCHSRQSTMSEWNAY